MKAVLAAPEGARIAGFHPSARTIGARLETLRGYRTNWYRGFWTFTVPLILVLWIGAVLVYFPL